MDRIKKLKVKKSDGSFTDYIPIGADAEYIDMADGDNLQEEINTINNKLDEMTEECGKWIHIKKWRRIIYSNKEIK